MFCSAFLYVHSSFAIILMGKREMFVFLFFVFLVSRDCCGALPHSILTVPQVCNQFVIMIFPDHTHYCFSQRGSNSENLFLKSFLVYEGKRVKYHFSCQC